MKKIVIVLTVLMIASVSVAQTMTPQQERQFFQKAYSVISDYAKYAKLQDDQDATYFLRLFENEKIQICNDLMSLSYERTLPVNEYVQLLYEKTTSIMNIVEITNIRKKGDIWNEDGVWLMSVTFNKTLKYYDKYKTIFDSKKFYGDYSLIMTLVWNGKAEKCYIRDLESIDDLREFPKEYMVLKRVDDRDDNIEINGKKTKNMFDGGQVIYFPGDVLRYEGAKLEVKEYPSGGGGNWYMADHHDTSWRIRLGGAYALNGYNVIGKNESLIIPNNDEVAINMDLGYVFPTTKHIHFGIFVGAGVSNNNFTMELKPDMDRVFEYNALSDADMDGEAYTRLYEFTGDNYITQEMKATDITIPIYLDMEYGIRSFLSLYMDIGVKIQTSKGVMTAISGEYKTWGKYDKYGNIEIGKDYKIENGKEVYNDVELNDFGKHNTIGIDEAGMTKKMTIDGIFGFGLRVNLGKTIAIDAGAQYQQGGNSWEVENNYKTEEGSSIFSYTLKDANNEGGDKVNLLRMADNISHKAWKASASLIIKF